jgi:hypothetical protein
VVILVAVALCLAFGATANIGAAGMRSAAAPKTLKIASIGYSQFFPDMAKAAQARFDEANKNKELPGGRTVDYLGLIDDKSTADGTIAAVRQAVEQDGAFAIIGTANGFYTPEYINQHHVPTIGWGVNDAFCTHGSKTPWYFFGVTGCLNATPQTPFTNTAWPYSVVKQMGATGQAPKGTTAGLIGEDYDIGKQGIETVGAGVEAAGFKIVYKKATLPPPPQVVSDYAPFVQDIMTSDNGQPPDVFFIVTAVSNALGLGTALTQAGYKGIDTNAIAYSPALTTTAKGWSAYTQWATPESADQGNTDMQKIVDTLVAAGIPKNVIGQTTLLGWLSADMFIKIAQKAGAKLTAEKWQKVASKFTYQLPKTIGPTSFPQGFAAPTPCAQLATSTGTTWQVTASYECYDLLNETTGKLIPYKSVNGSVKY